MGKVAFFIIVIGVIFVGIGLYELITTNANHNQALADAKSLLEKPTYERADKEQNDFEAHSEQVFPEDFNPSQGEAVGILHIPKLEADLAIIEGTDPNELAKGVGHYKGTAYPLQKDQIVLSGHRETVFRRMGELELGDMLVIQLPYGEFTYEIVHTEIVSADDLTVISPTAPDEVLTLTTCYPFNFIGNAPERYIITAHPVEEN